MTQQDKEYIKNYIKVTVIICSIILDILILINIKDIKREFTAIFDEMKSSTKVEETVEETTDDKTVEEEPDNTESEYNDYQIQLLTKYNSVFEWQKYGGDFGPEQLLYLDNLCINYNIPLEIMLSLICRESSFQSNKTVNSSTAVGYCQILKGTAKDIYENMLKLGSYDSNNHRELMTENWKLNLEMGCRYLYWTYNTYDKTWESALNHYHYGGRIPADAVYANAVNKNMTELFNMQISDFT